MRECERLFGSRFLRNVVRPGGMATDISDGDLASLNKLLARIHVEAESIIKIMRSSSSILDRLRTTAPLRREEALDFGTVGVVARGSGIGFDARFHLPYSVYRIHRPNVVVETDGDVQARITVRVGELRESIRYIGELSAAIPEGPVAVEVSEVDDGDALGWAETPRGMVLFWVEVREGKLARVKITSPSFLNWHAMPQAISGMIVPDFPLLNKSFGLSYSGCDG
jgi:Ni,Fe-hydrogenase III large subunit